MRPDRLSALDATFLALDTPDAPLHVGWTMRFDGVAPSLSGLRRHMEARLEQVPRFRRRVSRARVGDLRWTDDPAFDIARHVHRLTLPAPGGPAELRDLSGTLLSQPLAPDRPLWRLYLVDGLPHGFAVIGQAHHALVDGIAAIEVAMLLFAPAATTDGAPAEWRPERAPSSLTSAADAVSLRLRGSASAGAALGRAALKGPPTRSAIRDVLTAVDALARPSAPTVLDRTSGPARNVAFADVPLAEAKAAGKRFGATLNDMLLAACTLAIGRTLRHHGEHPHEIKVMIPVSTRVEGEEGGNRISFITASLPVREIDPVRVLRELRDQTRQRKQAGAAGPIDVLARSADLLPAAGTRAIARAAARAASFGAIVSNVPGPPIPLELLGRPLAAVYPAVPLLQGHALTIGAVSYCDRLHIGLVADRGVLPDVVPLAHDVGRAFDALRVADVRAHRSTPWRERARSRRTPAGV